MPARITSSTSRRLLAITELRGSEGETYERKQLIVAQIKDDNENTGVSIIIIIIIK